MDEKIISPCISICRTDPVTGYCYGCARTNEEKIVWKNGDRTADEYSYKLQDIVNDVGMKANDITAHTALADCLTLRECLYRVFSSKSLEEIRDCAKSALKDVEKSKLYKITKRLKF